MKKVEVRCRETMDFLKIGQLYSIMDDDCDIHINGSLTIENEEFGELKTVKVYANLCNEAGEILYLLRAYSDFSLTTNVYYSFSVYCADLSRFFRVDELAYVEIYTVFDEEEE